MGVSLFVFLFCLFFVCLFVVVSLGVLNIQDAADWSNAAHDLFDTTHTGNFFLSLFSPSVWEQ